MIKTRTAVLRTLLFFTVAGLPLMVQAGGGVKVKTHKESKTAIISLAELEAKQVRLSVEDASESITYFSAYVKNASDYRKAFDFSLLEDGDYVIVVNQNGELIKQSITIANAQVIVNDQKEVAKPVFKLVDEKLIVLFNNQEETNLLVSITGQNGVLFSEDSMEKRFMRKYNLSQLPSGEYNVTVFNNNEQYNYSIDL